MDPAKAKLTWNSALPPKGEWRGKLLRKELRRHRWLVLQPDEDVCRLYVRDNNLEYSFPANWESDGPSIPNAVCELFGTKREAFLKSGFLHDYIYRTARCLVREPGGEWESVELDKETADTLLRVGLLAEGSGSMQARIIYLGVHTKIANRLWRRHRNKERK
jgi:hypothetical protein